MLAHYCPPEGLGRKADQGWGKGGQSACPPRPPPPGNAPLYRGTGLSLAPPLHRRRSLRMRVLVIGSGGREHALCWVLSASPLLTKLWCAPGNPGIAQIADCVPIGVLDFPALVAFAQDNAIDLVVPGPEAPLGAGLTDAKEAAGIACCAPSPSVAQVEGS